MPTTPAEKAALALFVLLMLASVFLGGEPV